MSRKNSIHSPFIWFLLALVALEIFGGLLLANWQRPHAADVLRNPTPFRAWPEYVRAPNDVHGQKTVALIGNSQAVGREMRDPNDIYTAYLRTLAQAQEPSLNIENWSTEGIRLSEIELLSMQAVKRRAALLVIIISPRNLDRGGRMDLDFGGSDIDLLAGDPALWPMLHESALWPNTTLHDVLKRSVLLYSNIVRSRIAVHDIAAAELHTRWHTTVFGQRKNRIAHLSIEQAPLGTPRLPRRHGNMRAEHWQQQLEVQRRPGFDKLFGPLQQRLRANGSGLLWVWMPLPTGFGGESALRGVQAFQESICVTIKRAGFACVDLSGNLPDDQFLPLYQITHLNKQGHRRLAHVLFPLIRDAVH